MKIDYIIQKSHRRSICIQVSDDKKVIIKAPSGTPDIVIEKFLREKRSWIIRHIQKVERQSELIQKMGFISEDELKKVKSEAKKLIPQRVEYYANLSGISYNKIFIRLQKSRWGSCSAEGNLNFNCLLVLMPIEILDSVVVHELCHRRQMNHSKAFYDEVLKIFPDYKRCDKWLKENGRTYMGRVR